LLFEKVIFSLSVILLNQSHKSRRGPPPYIDGRTHILSFPEIGRIGVLFWRVDKFEQLPFLLIYFCVVPDFVNFITCLVGGFEFL
jgi:hypothetical protein